MEQVTSHEAGDIRQAKDVVLQSTTAENKRKVERKAMKVARIQIMAQVKSWDKLQVK